MRFHLLAIAAILCAPAASAFAVEQVKPRPTTPPPGTAIPLDLEGNVVEFDVLAVTVPSRLPNYCAVNAMVTRVWSGKAWREGMPLALNVPCAEYGLVPAAPGSDGFMPVNARSLQQSRQGIARLADNGEIMWHAGMMRPYGPWGTVFGYRVLDARMIPAAARPS
jgi:hypothetical protein